jgi:hypothetical protein
VTARCVYDLVGEDFHAVARSSACVPDHVLERHPDGFVAQPGGMVALVATLIDLLSGIVGEGMAVELVSQAVARLPWQRTAGTAPSG